MSKDLEAIEYLKNGGCVHERTMNKLLLLEKALKRNEPMKIIQTSNEQDFSLFDCPNCETTMWYDSAPEDWKYCIECGQKLDWSDDDENI